MAGQPPVLRASHHTMENDFYQPFDLARRGEEKAARPGEYRGPFQVDRDRIIHTSAFRRLQSKTQVFLSGEYDFYRTRLTHSIEVAQIGRSICARLEKVSPLLGEDFFIDPDLVEAACLAHDIGHPPFGHTGERTLHRLMEPYGGFEGNAQTLRLLTSTIFGGERGMNPSRALVDGVLKYKTLFGEAGPQRNHFLYRDQAGWLSFALGDHAFPRELSPGKARNQFRSIECQIMDWADDTAYSLNDLSDGIHASFITREKLESWAESRSLGTDETGLVEELLDSIRRDRVESFAGKKIGVFVAAADLVENEPGAFLAEESKRHRFRLAIDPAIWKACALYKKIAVDLVFRSQQLQQLDRKSDFILTRLFEVLAEHYIDRDAPGPHHFRLLSEPEEQLVFSAPDQQHRARLVCDSLARMSDGLAARTYKRLFDPDFGSIIDLE